MKKIFIVGFPKEMDEMGLARLAAPYGDIELLAIVYDKFTRESKGYAFIDMKTPEDAQAVIEALDGMPYGDRKLEVRIAQDKPVPAPGSKPKFTPRPGGYQKRDYQGGGQKSGGYQKRDYQGGGNSGGGYQKRDYQGGGSNGGGYQKRDNQGGGNSYPKRDYQAGDNSGYQRRDNQSVESGYQKRDYQAGDNSGYQKRENQSGESGYQKRDYQSGGNSYQKRDYQGSNNSGGYQRNNYQQGEQKSYSNNNQDYKSRPATENEDERPKRKRLNKE